tara:strand:+ start:19114 stop:19485 length:372 start_codon:yes stop_codon:yes gene_type:complete
MRLTKDFNRSEFDCNDGSVMPKEVLLNIQKLANQLQVLRDFLGVTITVNSAYRSPSYNKKIGGVSNSQHILGKAADITAEGYTPAQVYARIEKLIKSGDMLQGGLGSYSTFTHYDIRKTRARW